jgi:uncharacterized protein (DUF1330 family)
MNIVNAVIPTADQLQQFLGATEDGPFVMLNLLKFRDKAAYPDGSDAHLSGAEAYARYGKVVGGHVEAVGGKMGYAGRITGLMIGEVEELWDMMALAQYPSLAAMRTMILSPAYQEITRHREAGLAGQLNIKTRGAAL